MYVKQLTSPIDVVEYWPLFIHGLKIVAEKSKEELDEAAMLKTLMWLVNEPKVGYVGLATEGGAFRGFCVFQDATPPYISEKSFIARAIYSENGSQGTVVKLLSAFEDWARLQGAKRYIVTTRRHTGAAMRHFQSSKYGFTKGAITFEKLIQ